MTTLVLMYVYYDDEGNIKAISPTPDMFHRDHFKSATFPLADVDAFLTGMKNPFDYTICESRRPGSKSLEIIKKVSTVDLTRTLDNYLTKIDMIKGKDIPTIRVIINLIDKNIRLHLDSNFVKMYKDGNDEEFEDVDAFIKSGLSSMYVTKKNNPYHRLFTILFSPKELFEKGDLYFSYEKSLDFSDISIYTKKLVRIMVSELRGNK